MLRNNPPLLYSSNGVANSCRLVVGVLTGTHLDLSCVHDQDAIPRDDGAQTMCNAQYGFALELSMDGLLNPVVRFQVCRRQ